MASISMELNLQSQQCNRPSASNDVEPARVIQLRLMEDTRFNLECRWSRDRSDDANVFGLLL